MCEPQKRFFRLIRVKKPIFFVQSDFFWCKTPEISVKLGEGAGGSQFILELHIKCEVFAVIFFGGSPYFLVQTPKYNFDI